MGLYWKNHRQDEKRKAWVVLLAFLAVNSMCFALSCTFFAFKLDYLMDGLATGKSTSAALYNHVLTAGALQSWRYPFTSHTLRG